MLRTIFVATIIVIGLFQSFRNPFYALLFYLWIAYFRPEYWLWSDWFTQLNLSLIIGVVVLISTLMSGRGLRMGWGTGLMLMFLSVSLVSTVISPAFYYSWLYWQDFAKSTIISILIVTLIDTEERLRIAFLVIAFSLGLESVKQGWAQWALNPGAQNMNAYAGLGDNNGVAVGMFMLSAILVALSRTAPKRNEKLIERFALVGVLYRGLSTYSRGGFLACGALGIHYLLRSKRRFVAILGIGLVVAVIGPVLSDAYWERMNTIRAAAGDSETANETGEGRLHFWWVAVQMANDNPLTGVGHNAYNLFYDRYDTTEGEYGEDRAVHSSWFAVLAETGYTGLLIFLLLVGTAFRTARRARKLAKRHSELQHLAIYANAIEGALLVFAVGGSFVAFQYTEILWHMFAFSIVADRLVALRAKALVPAAPPVPVMPQARARIAVAAAARSLRA